MGRSLWKGPFVDSSILRENQKKQKKISKFGLGIQ